MNNDRQQWPPSEDLLSFIRNSLQQIPPKPINIKSKITCEIGILYCGSVRDFLQRCKWEGMDIEWYEGKGWFSRLWIIRGAISDLQTVHASLERWKNGVP